MNKKNKWMDVELGFDVRKYIRNGRNIIKMQKSIFAFDIANLKMLDLFLSELEMYYDMIDSLEKWRNLLLAETNDFETIIDHAPDRIREKLYNMTYNEGS